MGSKTFYQIRLARKSPYELHFAENGEITYCTELPLELFDSIELLIEAINSFCWDAEVSDDEECAVWYWREEEFGRFSEICGDLCFACSGDMNEMSRCYESVLDCDEGSRVRQRGEAKLRWVRWGTLDDPPTDDDDNDDNRDVVAGLCALRGDYLMSTGGYDWAIENYKKALEIYPGIEERLFGPPKSTLDRGLTFFQMVKRPLLYEKELCRCLDILEADACAGEDARRAKRRLADVKFVADAWKDAGFSKHAEALERVWKRRTTVLEAEAKIKYDELMSLAARINWPHLYLALYAGLLRDGTVETAIPTPHPQDEFRTYLLDKRYGPAAMPDVASWLKRFSFTQEESFVTKLYKLTDFLKNFGIFLDVAPDALCHLANLYPASDAGEV
jgi:tetratricopeptide (TPR) repeat protein